MIQHVEVRLNHLLNVTKVHQKPRLSINLSKNIHLKQNYVHEAFGIYGPPAYSVANVLLRSEISWSVKPAYIQLTLCYKTTGKNKDKQGEKPRS